MTHTTQYGREQERESEERPYYWINSQRGSGPRARIIVWVEQDVWGFDMEKWTVRKEEIDDSGRGQHKPTNLSTHSSKAAAHKAAVEWMRNN